MKAKYGTTIDRDSAYERINAKLAAARAAAAEAAARGQMSPTTDAGLNTMTPAQQRREIQRQAREIAAARAAAERERRAQAAADRKIATERARAQREQQKLINSALRGVLGTILGGRRR
jgi:molecular chaperone GrpE (heat shock protein)